MGGKNEFNYIIITVGKTVVIPRIDIAVKRNTKNNFSWEDFEI
ncbi:MULTISPECIES: hypothetical protein [Clostridium]|nr:MULTISPECIES: hypothetical protein [Clostridium]